MVVVGVVEFGLISEREIERDNIRKGGGFERGELKGSKRGDSDMYNEVVEVEVEAYPVLLKKN